LEWEENVKVKDGERTYITVKFPLLDSEGKLYAVGGLSTDITERKRAEQVLADYSHALEREVAQRTQELRENNRRLQETLKQLQDTQQRMILQENLAYLGTLTAGVAHEIQNPLNFVINFAQISSMLVEDLRGQLTDLRENPDASTEEFIAETLSDLDQNSRKINEHGERINAIVKSMLLHSRGISPAHAPAQLNTLLSDAIDLVYHGLRSDNPNLKIQFEKQFDPFLDEHKVRVVAQDLSRVFANIISNAVYAVRKRQESDPEGFEPRVVASTHVEEDLVEIRIRDNGGGIPAAARGELFKPFFTTKPTGEGTGLGLSICYDIIAQQHGGELRV
jgi:C4-dicarboxylate-specific signal transduction histidine kinase